MLLVFFVPLKNFMCWLSVLSDAALVMLSGQIADGFTTIFAGELVRIDIVNKCSDKFIYYKKQDTFLYAFKPHGNNHFTEFSNLTE